VTSSATYYRLDELAAVAGDLGFVSRRVDADRLDVSVSGAVLAFCNLRTEQDTLVGFDGTPWHSHGTVLFMTGKETSVECDELDLLIGLASGDLVVVTEYVNGVLRDRWLAHHLEPFDVKYMRRGEEVRICRLPQKTESQL
jgi:hypothetical protein